MEHEPGRDFLQDGRSGVEMAKAFQRQAERERQSRHLDRSGWTDRQWANDAERLMMEPDGAVTSLLNGHAMALIRERKRLAEMVDGLRWALEPDWDEEETET